MWQPVPAHPGCLPYGPPVAPGWQQWQHGPLVTPGWRPHGAPLLPPPPGYRMPQQKILVGWGCSCPLFCSICCAVWLLITYVSLIPFVEWAAYGLLYVGDWYHEKGPCTEFDFKAFDGGDLKGLQCHAGVESEQRRPAIVFGGNAMDMYDSAQHMPMVLPQGESWAVYSMSMPGRQYAGGRKVETSPNEAIKEALALLAHVKGETGQDAVVFGWSLGSSLAAGLAAHAAPGNVRCLLLGNPFTSFRELASKLTFGLGGLYYYLLDQWTTADWVAKVQAPTVVYSSLHDTLIPVKMHTEVYERSAAPKKMLIERQAGHMSFRPFVSAADDVLEMCSPPTQP